MHVLTHGYGISRPQETKRQGHSPGELRKGGVRTGVGALVESLCSDANFPAVPLASFAGGSGLNISSGHRVLFRPGWSASQGARTSAPVA